IKIDQQRKTQLCHLQVRNCLCAVYWAELLHHFYLDNQSFADENVDTTFAHRLSLIRNVNANLAAMWNTTQVKFMAERFTIRSLWQSRPQVPMHLDRSAND